MIFIDDLIDAMVALTDAPAEQLLAPQRGYAIAGFSFAPRELMHCLRALAGDSMPTESMVEQNMLSAGALRVTFPSASDDNAAARFAELWPNSLSGVAAEAHLQWRATRVPTLEMAVQRILEAHRNRS